MRNAARAVSPSSTEAVLQKHLSSARVGVDALMQDYTEASVMITHDATYRGVAEIRRFFTELFKQLPAGFFETTFRMRREEILGEVAYILWEGKPFVSEATDTFVVRDGKILFQTFTAFRG